MYDLLLVYNYMNVHVYISIKSLLQYSDYKDQCNKKTTNAAKYDTWRRINAVITLYTI